MRIDNDEDLPIVTELKKVRNRYAESFTVHGFSHVTNGRFSEKIIWTVLMIGALVGTGLMTYGLFKSYFNHEVNSNVFISTGSSSSLANLIPL